MLVVLGDGDRDLRDLMLLVAVHDTEIVCPGQVLTAVAAALGEPVATLFGVIGPGQMRARRAGLPRDRFGPPRPRCLSGGAGLPGSSSLEGGFEEFPELRDSRCSTLASRAVRASLASISSEIRTACAVICWSCAVICPAWRHTTTISSSRDSSSGSTTGRSNRTLADHTVIDTPTASTSHDARG